MRSSGRRPAVHLADVLHAAVALDASPDECIRIATLLDMPRAAPPKAPPSRRPRPPAIQAPPVELPITPTPSTAQPAQHAPSEIHAEASADDALYDLVGPLTSTSSGVLVLPTTAPVVLPQRASAPPPYEPLFAPASSRNILAAALSVEDERGPIDVARLIEALAGRRAITDLPRERSTTLRRGALVLVDRGDAMEPYQRDLAEVLHAIEHVVGSDRLARYTFDGAPTELARWDDGEPWTFSAPAGTPILLLSDLGLRRPSAEEAWDAFTKRALRAGCLLIALVPYPPARWPARLARRMRVVSWDRATTVAAARDAARRTGLSA